MMSTIDDVIAFNKLVESIITQVNIYIEKNVKQLSEQWNTRCFEEKTYHIRVCPTTQDFLHYLNNESIYLSNDPDNVVEGESYHSIYELNIEDEVIKGLKEQPDLIDCLKIDIANFIPEDNDSFSEYLDNLRIDIVDFLPSNEIFMNKL